MKFYQTALATIFLIISTNASAALLSRLGGMAYYDNVADLTWLANANTSGNTFDWYGASAWAESLNINGITGWRLPGTVVPDETCDFISREFNCTGSELGNMFYNVLGGVAGSSISTTHNNNYDLFTNIQTEAYWSTNYDNYNPWYFFFRSGYQDDFNGYRSDSYYAWAVHTGDVSAVPVPAAAWLFISGLIGLAAIAKQKQARN